ncbi:MAG: hypothetical protein NZO16_06815 [Deltaproteobacteria bacterium]|nr:hypothetical protein [Deltaproteobacteria bacterium]
MEEKQSTSAKLSYRLIIFAGLGLIATSEGQVLCRKNKDGVLVWSTRPSCPRGHSPVQKLMGSNIIADNAVGSLQISDGGVATQDLADNSVTDSKIQSVSWNKVQVNNNQIPWSKINTSNASLNANQIQGQIRNDQISSVDWSKVNVNEQEIPWKKINTLGLELDDLWNVPYYVYGGSSLGSLPPDEDEFGFIFPIGLATPSNDMDENLFYNHGFCYKFLLQIRQTAPTGSGAVRRFFLYSDVNLIEESECVIAGNSNECSSTFELDHPIRSFGLFFYNSTWVNPAKVSWQIVCAY